MLAQVRLAALAEEAVPAGAEQADDDTVAGLHTIDARADLLDDARCFVPVDGGQLASPRTVDQRDVAVADRGRSDANAHLALLRSVEEHVFDLERRAERPADRCLHGDSLSLRLRLADAGARPPAHRV